MLEFPATRICRVLKGSKLTNAPSRPVVEWRKHGLICICLPPRDLALYMDVQANPPPPPPLALADLRPRMPPSGIVPRERPLPADRISYSREELFSLRPRKCPLDVKAQLHQLISAMVCFDTVALGLTTGEGIRLEFTLFRL